MKREIDKELKFALIQLCKSSNDSPLFWKEYYEWCIKAYKLERNKRFSLSELGHILKKYEVKNSKELIVAYFHILYSLAIFEGDSVYGEGFNI